MPETDTIPVSASIASVGLGGRYIGQHFYALSGEFGKSTTEQTVLDILTGSGYIVGRITVSGPILTGSGGGGIATFQIQFNGETVLWLKVETTAEDQPCNTFADLILPPFTQMKVITDSDSIDANYNTTVIFTGRVYGAE